MLDKDSVERAALCTETRMMTSGSGVHNSLTLETYEKGRRCHPVSGELWPWPAVFGIASHRERQLLSGSRIFFLWPPDSGHKYILREEG